MAKENADREDLLREATGFTSRIELEIPQSTKRIFCGFRANGAYSLYWGQDTVIQFNKDRELRRAFWRDRMVASYKRMLHWLTTEDGERARLKRVAFSEAESSEFLATAKSHLEHLQIALRSEHVVIGEIPAGSDVASDVLHWLEQLESLELAVHPGVGN